MGSLSNAPRPGHEDALPTANVAPMLRVEDVAKQLRLSRSKIYTLIDSGKLVAHRLPAIRVAEQDLNDFLAGCRDGTRAPEPPIRSIKLKHLR